LVMFMMLIPEWGVRFGAGNIMTRCVPMINQRACVFTVS